MNYLLLTVVRDEAKHLLQAIEAIRKQTQLPELWLIVDDGSQDGTSDILASIKEKWLVTIRCQKRPPKSLMHYSQLLADYANHIAKLAAQRELSWEALAVVDGDSVPEPDYFTALAAVLGKDENMGIVSGELVESSTMRKTSHRHDNPWGAAVIYRRECLEAIGGLSPTQSHNSVEIALVQARGWRTGINDEVCFEHLRPMGSSGGWYRGHTEMGSAARWLGMPASFALAKAARLTLSRHPSRGLGYLIGYLCWRGGRCQIPEVQAAYRKRWRVWWRSGVKKG